MRITANKKKVFPIKEKKDIEKIKEYLKFQVLRAERKKSKKYKLSWQRKEFMFLFGKSI